MDEYLYSWKFSTNKSRASSWYVITLSIVIGLVLWGFLTGQYGMSFIILLIVGLYYFVENNSEDIYEVFITSLGIKIGDSFYDFGSIDSFGLIYNGDDAVILRLNLNKKGLRNLDLMIDNNIATDLKSVLPQFIEEKAKQELGFKDKIIKLLKL